MKERKRAGFGYTSFVEVHTQKNVVLAPTVAAASQFVRRPKSDVDELSTFLWQIDALEDEDGDGE